MSNIELKFLGKHIINATLVLKSGMHIGGMDEGFNIGGIDSIVIKNPMNDQPIIPGSTLKGKMRSLLEWQYDLVKSEVKENKIKGKSISILNGDFHPIAKIFGAVDTKDQKSGELGPVRGIFRDSNLLNIEEIESMLDERIFTEVKAENSIDRITSEANPRFMERAVAESKFNIEIVLDNYLLEDYKNIEYILQGMKLLEMSYLGGGGSRGNGQIKFEDIKIIKIKKENIFNNKFEVEKFENINEKINIESLKLS